MIGSSLRSVVRLASVFAVLTTGLAPLPAAAQGVLPGLRGTNGPVYALAVSGNTLYVGGAFSQLAHYSGAGVVVDATTGGRLADSPAWTSTEFPPGGIVFAVAPDGAGGWFIGGIFSTVGGLARQNLAHIAANRTVSAWNPGANAPVRALLTSGTTLYVGGDFTQIGGQPRGRLAALHTTTAAVQAWNPGVGVNGIVQALALLDTTLYVGGDFSQIGGQPRTDLAAVGTGAGAVTAWAPAITGFWVETIALDAGLAYIGGLFSSVNGMARDNLAAVSLATGAQTSWSPDANSTVHVLAVTADAVYAGGDFDDIGGRTRNGVARLNKTTGAAIVSWNAGCDGPVWDLEPIGASLRVAGGFSSIGGQPRANAASLVAATAVVEGWAPAVDNVVKCLQTEGSQTFLGGQFQYADVVRRNNLAAVDMTTLAVTAWNPDASGTVLSLATDGATLYAGGAFGQMSGQARQALAAFNVGTGALLPFFDAHVNQGNAMIPEVHALSLDGGVLRVGGKIATLGATPRNWAGAVDPATGAALPWAPEPSGPVYAFAVAPSGTFLAGDFLTVQGSSRPLVAQVDPTSGVPTVWLPPVFYGGFRPNGVYLGPNLRALNVRDDELFVGGSFTTVDGQTRNNAASLDVATAAVGSWTPPNGWVADLAYGVRAFETSLPPVFVGTVHPFMNGLLALDPVTGAPNLWPPQVSWVRALARWNAYLLLGGDFQTVGTVRATGLAALSDPSVVGVPPDGKGGVAIALSAPAPNPTRGDGQLVLTLPAPADVSVHVLDLAGRRVHTALAHRRLAAGHHPVRLDLSRHAPGLYLVEALAGGHRATRKLVVTR